MRGGGERTGVRLLSSPENGDKSDGSLVDVDDAQEPKYDRERDAESIGHGNDRSRAKATEKFF